MSEYAVAITVSLAGGEATPAAWHGWVYRTLGRRGDDYHRAGLPPFTLQPIGGWSEVRIVLLDGSLAGALAPSRGTPGPGGRAIGGAAWEIKPYEALSPPAQVARVARGRKELVLEFVTPVAFKQGPYIMIVPLPRLLFGGLKRVWDQFVSLPLPGFDAAACERHVEIPWLELTTRQVDTGLGPFRGAVGQAAYRWPDSEGTDALPTLAAFAEFAGAGMKRAFGMGVVRPSRVSVR